MLDNDIIGVFVLFVYLHPCAILSLGDLLLAMECFCNSLIAVERKSALHLFFSSLRLRLWIKYAGVCLLGFLLFAKLLNGNEGLVFTYITTDCLFVPVCFVAKICSQQLSWDLRYEERGLEWTISHPTVWTLLLQMTWRNKWGRTCNLCFLRLYYRRNRNLVIYLQLHSILRPLRSQFIIKQLAIWWF